jgi:hypothetical protein
VNIITEKFLDRYPEGEKWDFPTVRFRGKAGDTLPMGLFYYKDPKQRAWMKEVWPNEDRWFYEHPGHDRARGRIVIPFVGEIRWYPDIKGYGSVFVLYPEGADFALRWMHMDDISPEMKKKHAEEKEAKAGEYVGETGSKGTGKYPHSHAEIVSLGETSKICDDILKEKGIFDKPDLIEKIRKSKKYTPEEKEYVEKKIVQKREVKFMTENRMKMRDMFTKLRIVTYYDTRAVFNI